MNDEQRRLWILNDEGLYDRQRRSGRTLMGFIRHNRKWLDQMIEPMLAGTKPSHFLKYGRTEAERTP